MRASYWGFLTLIVLLAGALVGCVHQPQNPEEFRQCIEDGHGAKDSYVVHRPFDDVYLSLHDKTVPGFNQRSIDSFLSGNRIDHSQNLFTCKLTGQGGRAELVIQKVVYAIGPTMPEGGWFWLVTNLEKVQFFHQTRTYNAGTALVEYLRQSAPEVEKRSLAAYERVANGGGR